VPGNFQRLRFTLVVCDFIFQLRLRHHRIERRLEIGPLSRPDSVTPVNFLNGSLIIYAFFKREHSLENVS
jgi:hypothetical protein